MKRVNVCFDCRKTLRLFPDVGLVVYRSGEDWYFEFWLIVDDFSVFSLFGAVHRGFVDQLFLAEKQGRLDDLEEEALFEEADRLREGEEWRKASLER